MEPLTVGVMAIKTANVGNGSARAIVDLACLLYVTTDTDGEGVLVGQQRSFGRVFKDNVALVFGDLGNKAMPICLIVASITGHGAAPDVRHSVTAFLEIDINANAVIGGMTAATIGGCYQRAATGDWPDLTVGSAVIEKNHEAVLVFATVLGVTLRTIGGCDFSTRDRQGNTQAGRVASGMCSTCYFSTKGSRKVTDAMTGSTEASHRGMTIVGWATFQGGVQKYCVFGL